MLCTIQYRQIQQLKAHNYKEELAQPLSDLGDLAFLLFKAKHLTFTLTYPVKWCKSKMIKVAAKKKKKKKLQTSCPFSSKYIILHYVSPKNKDSHLYNHHVVKMRKFNNLLSQIQMFFRFSQCTYSSFPLPHPGIQSHLIHTLHYLSCLFSLHNLEHFLP